MRCKLLEYKFLICSPSTLLSSGLHNFLLGPLTLLEMNCRHMLPKKKKKTTMQMSGQLLSVNIAEYFSPNLGDYLTEKILQSYYAREDQPKSNINPHPDCITSASIRCNLVSDNFFIICGSGRSGSPKSYSKLAYYFKLIMYIESKRILYFGNLQQLNTDVKFLWPVVTPDSSSTKVSAIKVECSDPVVNSLDSSFQQPSSEFLNTHHPFKKVKGSRKHTVKGRRFYL